MSLPTQHERWLKVAANLRVDRKHDIAPHKPLLLLAIVGLAEEGNLAQSTLRLTGELTFRFLGFWTIVAGRRSQRPDIRLPFFHLHSDGCWTPIDKAGVQTTDRRQVAAARLDETFLDALRDDSFRQHLRRILIAKYFTEPAERATLYTLVGMPVPPDDVVKADADLYAESRERGREARFRLTVVPAYDYSCALTGYRCVTVGSGSIVDAAHIHQFADSRNNHPRNGIALSKNAHWMFDQGLWSLTDDYKVIVAAHRFNEAGREAFLLGRKAGKMILLPADKTLWPDTTHLAWHRKHKLEAA